MQTAGTVLAGGRSTRMGTDKAFLVFERRTLLEIAAGAVLEVAGNVTIIGSPDLYGKLGFPVIPDLRPGAGPLAGIETALTHAPATDSGWTLVVACDMPRVTSATLRQILAAALANPGALAVIPESAPGKLEPLCAAYHQRGLPFITRALDSGLRKVTAGLPQELVHVLTVADPQVFQNLNTPDDLQLAKSSSFLGDKGSD